MRFAGNAIWFVLGGWYISLLWLIGAGLFALTIVGLPLTRAAIEMAKMSAWPFGKEVVHIRDLDDRKLDAVTATTGTIGFIFNVIWALSFGVLLFLCYLLAGVLCFFTIIGIPFALQSWKLAGISLWPVGRRVVTVELADLVRRDHAATKLASFRKTSV